MIKEYAIEGMTCKNCVARVTEALTKVSDVTEVKVQLSSPQLRLQSNNVISLDSLSTAIGKYKISPIEQRTVEQECSVKPSSEDLPEKSLTTYKPLFIIVAFIIGTTALVQYPFTDFHFMTWMRHFMAGFFLVFSFFKLLNVAGFASSYSMYDIIAKRWYSWGYIYPFIELGLGVMYLINAFPFITNVVTIVILGISSIGVIQSNIQKRSIKCACLGDVFQLPMSTITIIEDVSMVLMAIIMLII